MKLRHVKFILYEVRVRDSYRYTSQTISVEYLSVPVAINLTPRVTRNNLASNDLEISYEVTEMFVKLRHLLIYKDAAALEGNHGNHCKQQKSLKNHENHNAF